MFSFIGRKHWQLVMQSQFHLTFFQNLFAINLWVFHSVTATTDKVSVDFFYSNRNIVAGVFRPSSGLPKTDRTKYDTAKAFHVNAVMILAENTREVNSASGRPWLRLSSEGSSFSSLMVPGIRQG